MLLQANIQTGAEPIETFEYKVEFIYYASDIHNEIEIRTA